MHFFFLIKQNFCLNCFSRHNNSYYHRLKIDKMLCNFFNFFSEKFGGFPPSKTCCEWRVAGGRWRVAGGVASGAVPFELIPTRLIMFCPENDPLKLKRPNPSETFEMSLKGGVGSGNYTITVRIFMSKNNSDKNGGIFSIFFSIKKKW